MNRDEALATEAWRALPDPLPEREPSEHWVAGWLAGRATADEWLAESKRRGDEWNRLYHAERRRAEVAEAQL